MFKITRWLLALVLVTSWPLPSGKVLLEFSRGIQFVVALLSAGAF